MKRIGGTGFDHASGVAIDNEGNPIVVGGFSNSIPLGSEVLTSAGERDIYVTKLSALGELIWSRRFGGIMIDDSEDLTVDLQNNVYVTGFFRGVVDFGNGPIQSTTSSDSYVLKLTPSGDLDWVRTSPAGFRAIASDGEDIVVAGFYTGTITIGATTFTSSGNSDVLVVKMTSTGAVAWARSFGGTKYDLAKGIAVDSDHNVIVVGQFADRVNFGGGFLMSRDGFDDVFLLKLDSATGAHLLSRRSGGGTHDYVEDVDVDAQNNIYITGAFGMTADFGCTDSLVAGDPVLRDIFLVKYTQAGACVWSSAFGGNGTYDRMGVGVAVNATGDVAMSGAFCGSISIGGELLTSAGPCSSSDAFIAQFTTDGTHQRSIRLGGTLDDAGGRLAYSPNGGLIGLGGFQGFAEFNDEVLTSAGDLDAFILAVSVR